MIIYGGAEVDFGRRRLQERTDPHAGAVSSALEERLLAFLQSWLQPNCPGGRCLLLSRYSSRTEKPRCISPSSLPTYTQWSGGSPIEQILQSQHGLLYFSVISEVNKLGRTKMQKSTSEWIESALYIPSPNIPSRCMLGVAAVCAALFPRFV